MQNKHGFEALVLAGIVIFTIANGIMTFEAYKEKQNNPQLDLLKRIVKKLKA